jgi:hypothetical protein
MANEVQSKCLCCGEIFTVDVRNRGRQKYCSTQRCRAAGKAARQQRWQRKSENQDYFRGAWNVERVREWRSRHPGYWRTHRRRKRFALQDALIAQPAENTKDTAAGTLQDALHLQGPILIGLIAQLTDSTLQDSIAATTRALLQLGQDILSGGKNHGQQTGAAP